VAVDRPILDPTRQKERKRAGEYYSCQSNFAGKRKPSSERRS
jgi:hypothetical protein